MDNANKKILIVEDDEFLRSLASKRLEREGYKVVVAVDGESAIGTVSSEKPDLILLDLLLPGMDGFEVLSKVRSDASQVSIPVVVFSNLGQREDIEKAKKLGATDFLIKANFTLDDVVAKIGSILK